MRVVMRSLFGLVLAPLLVSQASAALPNEGLMCRADDPRMDKHGYLRALMLDLTGNIPTPEDYARLESESDVPEEMIDELLASDAFVARTVRAHRALLWNNVDNVALLNYQTSLIRTGPERLYWRRRPAITYRGEAVPCRDEPATFDANGQIETTPDGNGNQLEGYVNVAPYWDPSTTIKVCAFDAQTAARSPGGQDCASLTGLRDPGCGCGENLNLCRYGNYSAINRAMATDLEMRIAALLRDDRPYTEIFTSRRAFVNGPLVHYLKYQTGVPAGVRTTPVSYDVDRLPNLDYADDYDNWVEIELDDAHAGVLTSPAYLLRFQTNRARASRFFDSFLCQPLSPPAGGLPASDPNKPPHPDLQQRDGCKYCHALLEPAAAHWGRWGERGAGYLDPIEFPTERDDCRHCGQTGQLCSRDCRDYYVTNTYSSLEEPYIGKLNAYNFLKPQHQRNVEYGPKLLLAQTTVDARFPTCVARRGLEGLFGRSLDADEEEWLETLAQGFVASNYDYKALIKSIVMSPVYRRVR